MRLVYAVIALQCSHTMLLRWPMLYCSCSKLVYATALIREQGCLFIATNLDHADAISSSSNSANGGSSVGRVMPGTGSLVAAVQVASGVEPVRSVCVCVRGVLPCHKLCSVWSVVLLLLQGYSLDSTPLTAAPPSKATAAAAVACTHWHGTCLCTHVMHNVVALMCVTLSHSCCDSSSKGTVVFAEHQVLHSIFFSCI